MSADEVDEYLAKVNESKRSTLEHVRRSIGVWWLACSRRSVSCSSAVTMRPQRVLVSIHWPVSTRHPSGDIVTGTSEDGISMS